MDCYIEIINRKICHTIRLSCSELIVLTEFIAKHWSFPTFETVPICFSDGDLQFTFYDNTGFHIMRKSTINHEKSIYLNNEELKSMEMYFPGLIFMMNLIQNPYIFPTNKNPLQDTLAFSKLVKSEIKSLDEALPEEKMIDQLSSEDVELLDDEGTESRYEYKELFKYFGRASSSLLAYKGEFLKNLKDYYGNDYRVLRSLTLLMKTITKYK